MKGRGTHVGLEKRDVVLVERAGILLVHDIILRLWSHGCPPGRTVPSPAARRGGGGGSGPWERGVWRWLFVWGASDSFYQFFLTSSASEASAPCDPDRTEVGIVALADHYNTQGP